MSSSDSDKRITKDDLEAKFRETVGSAEETKDQVRNVGIAVGAAVLVLLVLLAFLGGKKSGKKGSTVVEVRRI